MLRITCLGGAGSVTGSCFLVESPQNGKVLVDCGLFQGGRQMESRNQGGWGFDPAEIQTLFLTHAHVDHSGRIPKLVRDGFRGRIITSPPTAELCEIMLLDAAHIQEMDAEWQTRKNKRQARRKVTPLYTTEDAEAALKLLNPTKRDTILTVAPALKARLRNAGHILGSSILELWVEDQGETLKIVFSGDLGRKDQLIVRDPHEIFDADYLFVESTYGDRLHRDLEGSKKELIEAVRYSAALGEKIIIPAFAVERTQEILYILGEFLRQGLIPDIPIYLDSPLAIKATEIFRKNKQYYDEEASAIVDSGYDPIDMPNLRFTPTTRESIAINERKESAIIIAGSGMCTAGRIKHHLKHNLWREGASIVIVGFQAKGTTGRMIVDGAKKVKIFRENVAVRARVFTIGGFSAHADQEDLLHWVSHFESDPKVFVIHGESNASQALADKIHERLNLVVHVPTWKERLILKPKEIASEKPQVSAEKEDVNIAMINAIIDLENKLKTLRKKIGSGEMDGNMGEGEMDRLKYIQDELDSVFVS
ncbi:MAG: MBL fold metallo-hydrolase [Deltaproteobacteria bacterium]|nr:MBL fold metallo-hydrolase [Deltaproteobacteria bacterium]HDZ91463.1 MBL fold metallo-hydrolase [Deltaproteobacteria bacterium]